jgi:sugar (pentulose or hexulose) kinase
MNKDSGVALHRAQSGWWHGRQRAAHAVSGRCAGRAGHPPRCVSETTALGAAYAAGLAVGFWTSEEELRANWQIDREWHPKMSPEAREAGYRGWLKAVERTFGWVE